MAAQVATHLIDSEDARVAVGAALAIVVLGALSIAHGELQWAFRFASAHFLRGSPLQRVVFRPAFFAVAASNAGAFSVTGALPSVRVAARGSLLGKGAALGFRGSSILTERPREMTLDVFRSAALAFVTPIFVHILDHRLNRLRRLWAGRWRWRGILIIFGCNLDPHDMRHGIRPAALALADIVLEPLKTATAPVAQRDDHSGHIRAHI